MEMKHVNIKNILIGLALAGTISSIYSCSKDNTGPVGAQGATGPQGPPGTASVRVYHWGKDSTNSGVTNQSVLYTLLKEKYSQIDSIEWHFYVAQTFSGNNRDYWYHLPSVLDLREDYFRVYPDHFPNKDTLSFMVERMAKLSQDPTKTAKIYFAQAKAVLVPAGTFTNLRTSINWDDYNDVKSKLNIRDEDEILVK